MPKSAETSQSQKTHKIRIWIFKTENFNVLNTLRIDSSRPYNLATCALRDSLEVWEVKCLSQMGFRRFFFGLSRFGIF